MSARQLPIILALGTTQTLAWASSYYLPAILADPIARDLGISTNWLFAAFSMALVISGLLGPRVGRQIDRMGGREVLCASNLILASGLILLGLSQGTVLMAASWLLLGVGMGLGLYDAAFAALGRIYGNTARRSITGITLIAGFASTIGWPLTAWGLGTIGWRWTCFGWAAAHILICLPLNAFLIPKLKSEHRIAADTPKPHIPIDRAMVLLAFAFAAAWSVTSAMAVHLPRILEALGATQTQAIAAGALIGPAQVAGKDCRGERAEALSSAMSARLACITHPLGACVIGLFGGGFAGIFALLSRRRKRHPHDRAWHAAAGDIRSEGLRRYRFGLLGAPSRMSQAAAPLVFGLLIEAMGSRVLIVSSALSLSALLALFMLRKTWCGRRGA